VRPTLPYLCQRRFRLGQPEGHVHGAVKVDSRGHFGTGLLGPVGLGIEAAEAAVAVGLQRAHAEFLGQGEALAVGLLSWLDLWRIAARADLAEEPKGPCLRATFLAVTGERQGTLCKWDGLRPDGQPGSKLRPI
jgi:hypothetical protein